MSVANNIIITLQNWSLSKWTYMAMFMICIKTKQHYFIIISAPNICSNHYKQINIMKTINGTHNISKTCNAHTQLHTFKIHTIHSIRSKQLKQASFKRRFNPTPTWFKPNLVNIDKIHTRGSGCNLHPNREVKINSKLQFKKFKPNGRGNLSSKSSRKHLIN